MWIKETDREGEEEKMKSYRMRLWCIFEILARIRDGARAGVCCAVAALHWADEKHDFAFCRVLLKVRV